MENFNRSLSVLFVFKSVGDIFLKMLGLASVMEKFVWGESGPEEVDKQDGMDDKIVSSSFVAKTHPSLLNSDRDFFFRDFHDFTLKCG